VLRGLNCYYFSIMETVSLTLENFNEARPANQSKSCRTKPYCSEICGEPTNLEKVLYFRLRIHRGFRHQIHCHLTWAGFPVLNDSLYGGQEFGKEIHLAFRAEGIMFFDPGSGEKQRYALPGSATQNL